LEGGGGNVLEHHRGLASHHRAQHRRANFQGLHAVLAFFFLAHGYLFMLRFKEIFLK
jgi:hypothetical protein